ncbi:RHS repeat-associated core domain-containing protein [Streptomyces sp. NA02950]|uniref:RHS repeat-associated core domain-containing protein n=1 Tax=Streptomyces sp. NA02950 TaxID=2742137 RepID=UPI0020CB3CA9|nr:RHS repeat-associated core domain-containing protein [Streptomyces sp. NA02950]
MAKTGPDGNTVTFTWDDTRLAERISPDGTVTTWDYAPGTHRPVSQSLHRTRTARPENTGSILALADIPQSDDDARFHAIVTDLVGTPTELVTPDGTLAWQARTTLWGTLLPTPPDDTDCPLRFPGQYADPETGLHYNHHRYYDPETAGYLTPDPLGLAPAPNPYSYVSNPHTWQDPLGLEGCGEPLTPLHPDSSLDRSSLDFWHKQDTEDIVFSLRPGAHEPLIVKPDGTIMNGNTRIAVLRSRGYDVDSLPRESYGGGRPMTDEDFWDMDQ